VQRSHAATSDIPSLVLISIASQNAVPHKSKQFSVSPGSAQTPINAPDLWMTNQWQSVKDE
jgi:hypothetical protein